MLKRLPQSSIDLMGREGYAPGVPVLTPEEVARYRAEVEGFPARHPEHVKKLNSAAHALCPWATDMGAAPGLVDVFEDLFGPDLVLRNVAWRVKKPDGNTFAGWHQDHLYLGEIDPPLVLGILALSDCDAARGCLRVIPGSHRWGTMPHEDYDDPTSILARGQRIAADIDETKAVDLTLKPGEMALIDTRVIHGSAPNNGPGPRIMALVSLQPTRAKRIDGARETGILVRGTDAYGNFDPVPRPDAECSEAALATWKEVAQRRGRFIFTGSALPMSENYGGDRRRSA